jgi:hypothetical protein
MLVRTFSHSFKKLKVKGHFSQTSRYEVKQVPVLTKNGFGLKKRPQHFFFEGLPIEENKYSPCMSHIDMNFSHLRILGRKLKILIWW